MAGIPLYVSALVQPNMIGFWSARGTHASILYNFPNSLPELYTSAENRQILQISFADYIALFQNFTSFGGAQISATRQVIEIVSSYALRTRT